MLVYRLRISEVLLTDEVFSRMSCDQSDLVQPVVLPEQSEDGQLDMVTGASGVPMFEC
jgi:hypothetical protein